MMRIPSRLKKGREAQRAIAACLLAVRSGRVTPTQVKNVLDCEGVDLTVFTQFLGEGMAEMVRVLVADIVAKCEPAEVVKIAVEEAGNPVLLNAMCRALEQVRFKDVEPLMPVLRGENVMASNRVLRLFVEVGRADLLFPLVFDGDSGMVERVKRYLHGQGLL
jgi:hypothetical protein